MNILKLGLFSAIMIMFLFSTFLLKEVGTSFVNADGDTTPPSTPTGQIATSTGPMQIIINWKKSTDNVGVAGYNIIKNGTLYASTSALVYTDTELYSDSWFTYNVQAFDAAGNTSTSTKSFAARTQKWPAGTFSTSTLVQTVFLGARMRALPTTTSTLRFIFNQSATGTVLGSSVENMSITWWPITARGNTGWLQEKHIAPTTTPTTTAPEEPESGYSSQSYSTDAYGVY